MYSTDSIYNLLLVMISCISIRRPPLGSLFSAREIERGWREDTREVRFPKLPFSFPSISVVYIPPDMNIDFSLFVITGEGDTERIQHPFHHHPLKLLPLVPERQWLCNICEIGFIRQQIWRCEEDCNFFAHKHCLHQIFPETVQLKHGSQVVSWSLYPPWSFSSECVDCHKYRYSNPQFREEYSSSENLCITCYLVRKLIGDDEESSLQVAKVIHHFFHPCALELIYSPSTTCNACFLNHSHLSYYCKDCHFFLDFECAQLPEVSHVDDNSNQIHHFCHWHPLQPFPDEAIDGETLCQLCESSSSSSSSTTSDPFYGCTQCQFYAHKSCIDILPQQIDHPLLDDTVVLLTVPSYVCTTCDRACLGLVFFYPVGDYYFCVKCTLQFRNEVGVFKSFRHGHLLRPRETNEVDKSHCFLCKKECSGRYYECSKCSTYCHKWCAELPRELQHPSHPQHRLTFTFWVSLSTKCKLCLGDVIRDCYGCSICKFYLDFRCASLVSFIQYQGHPHLLCAVDHLSHDDARCNKCYEILPRDFPVLLCQECDFSVHLLCGPLPCKIKDPLHAHPLTLREYYVEDNVSDEFACHICEKKRNPRLRVYICTEGCLMTCDVKCVLTEVVASLRGELGVMELDTVYPKVACEMITRDSISDLKEIRSGGNVATDVPVFSYVELLGSVEDRDVCYSDSETHTDCDCDLSKYPYSRKGLKHFIKNFEWIGYHEDDFINIFSKHNGSCTGGDYLLPNALHSVYSDFFEEHNIFDPGCNLNYDDKRFIVFSICSILHDMRMIKVVDVSAERISLWSTALKCVEDRYKNDGLELDSLFKHITRIAEDHYLVQSVNIIEVEFSELCKEKEGLSNMKAWLARKVAENESKIEDNKQRLKSFRAYRYAGASETKKEYYASLENKWRPCYEC